MTNRELDCVIIGFSMGSLAFLWAGYKLGARVERWRSGRAVKRAAAKSIPFDGSNSPAGYVQNARHVLTDKPRLVPLKRRDLESPTLRQPRRTPIPIVRGELDPAHDPSGLASFQRFDVTDKLEAAETARVIREDALAALTGAGYKRAAAEAALDACSLTERAGGLESWVAAAFRHARAKP